MTMQEILTLINEAEKESKIETVSGFHKLRITEKLFPAIQSAILTEREACAKICESYSLDLGAAFTAHGALGRSGLGEKIMEGFRIAASEIRARSNPTPEIENKPLESSKMSSGTSAMGFDPKIEIPCPSA